MFLTVTTIVINFILAFILLQTADWTIANEFGILQWLPQIPLWLYVVIGFVIRLNRSVSCTLCRTQN
jgi:hypothetical protein